MTSLRFTVPGRPVTWQRTNDVRGRRVTDAAQREAKQWIALHAMRARPQSWPMDATYAIEVIGYWPDWRVGDSDRLTSLVMDALQGIAYRVDRQVRPQAGHVLLDRDRPRTEVHVVSYLPPRQQASIDILIEEVSP